ncbi:ANL_collapsed_G0018490.mRNA.1.CDS.1 [Saccharomyces cerevisiae]|nr:AVN_HP_G0013050.mRNA.1.CDS.1 [Saccharomyces cerevisiae]CAI4997884.1 ANL_HP_G0051920.mRNA.1.CDS.1 [Saccharomyces cerevisiae]CAI5030599.1 AVN_HP_G0070760.mRNA.1.CDS.1 [Saccharomyces cerevisiae]CAI5153765.1 ANL_HP_G0123240.mRNA.1.CDS.1 [Saccharomyces cerevisiae]CAI6656760.1 ANL_collapsed_G0018490.mRNA.1.CDS.1 [Saccharomyces cerevisiae]
MDEILAKAGSQAVTFAIKSGISIASTYALKTITNFVVQIPKDDARRIDQLKFKLESRMAIVSSAIDLIKLVAARGNTNLQITLRLTKDLKEEIDRFDEKINEMTQKVEGSRSAKTQNEAIKAVENYIKDLLLRIEEITPFINLSLTTSGANLNSALPYQLSPGLLLKASDFVSENNRKYEKAMKSNEKGTGDKEILKVQVGPTFEVTLFSIFYNLTSENNGQSGIVWKEDMKRAKARIYRLNSTGRKYDYFMKIEQDFNDGRYHEDDDKEDTPQELAIDLNHIKKLFFSVSGKLLRLEEQDSPVLVLKIDRSDDKENESSEGDKGLLDDITWYAVSGYEAIEEDEEEDEEEGEEEGKDGEERKEEEEEENKLEDKDSSITLLEYIIRLTSLQSNDQKSILEVSDERLSIYLNDENTNSRKDRISNSTIEETEKKLKNLKL